MEIYKTLGFEVFKIDGYELFYKDFVSAGYSLCESDNGIFLLADMEGSIIKRLPISKLEEVHRFLEFTDKASEKIITSAKDYINRL